jgi:predicted RNA-binding protein YlxR (DUF448 family)
MNLESSIRAQTGQRHTPERSCITCRGKKTKKELIRLVHSAGAIKIDPKEKQAGRGAYLCPVRECWEAGLKSNRLEYALRTKLTLENRKILTEFGSSLPRRKVNTR